MGDFRVHHARFFEFKPNAIHCMSLDNDTHRLAVSRSDGSVEIWSWHHNWYQQKVMPPQVGHSVEALCWCCGRLFSAGLSGDLLEYDLVTLTVKHCVSSNSGAIWCLTKNSTETCIAAGTEDGCVAMYQVTKTDVEYDRALDRQEGRILSIAWYDPEGLIITGGIDNIRIWSIKSGHAIRRLTLAKSQWEHETIVWAVLVTSDFTIISGDSRGRTSFWNGTQGTLIKDFLSHKADVLCLAANKAGNRVYSAGIDPVITQFDYVPINPNSDLKMWVKGQPRHQHSHDIRALEVNSDCVISGGVDTQLIVNRQVPTNGVLSWKRFSPIPPQPMVYTAKAVHSVLLRYPDYLELWRLGSTTSDSEKSGEILPLKTSPIKLLQLKSKNDEYIVTAAVSSQGDWLAYSDAGTLRLFQVTLEEVDSACPQVSLTRVRYLPSTQPARLLAFTADGSKLVSATVQGTIQVLALDRDQPAIHCTFDIPGDTETTHLLTVSDSGRYVAAANNAGTIVVFDIKKKRHVCNLPQYDKQPTALGLDPTDRLLVVAYCDMKVMEFNLRSKQYTPWSRHINQRFHHHWLKRHTKLSQIMYNPHNPKHIFFRDELVFGIIDKTQRMPTMKDNLFNRPSQNNQTPTKEEEKRKHAFHFCTKYKYLMHLDILEDDFLLVVERPVLALQELYPPSLKLKKFGVS